MDEKLKRARISLEGLSVGDAFGERFFLPYSTLSIAVQKRTLPKPPWPFTDDTNMASSIYANLREFGEIRQDELAQSYAEHYSRSRGYGPAMHRLLARIRSGERWQEAAPSLFDGSGSYGNGGAMRVAPVGAYFADDLERIPEQAQRSAEVTHAHSEGIAGAIAIAAAAGIACQFSGHTRPIRSDFIDAVLTHVPDSEVKSGLRRARDIETTNVRQVARMIGNGSAITAQDTVPFTVWCAAEYLDDYETAMWQTIQAQGDVDTNCAIVGGIVAGYVGLEGIPNEWIAAREPLPAWATGNEEG